MQLSKDWLLEWVNPEKSTQTICDQLTAVGLEVDSVQPVAAKFTGLVVAKIISAEPHPDADKLKVCLVDDGKQQLQIVCGGKNARDGIKVVLATVGAVLPGDFKIKPAKLRGKESFGMLCSESELGLAESSEGILELPADAPLGEDIRHYLKLDDAIIDIDLTPNRGDCLSIKGLARELGVINQIDVTPPTVTPVAATHDNTVAVTIKAQAACPRYCSRVINNIDHSQQTPLWMQEKLRRGGVRSICPVVDVTNYVSLELGQPMHAFDLKAIEKQIVVRFAKADEALELLDGQHVSLNEKTLIVADQKQPLAIAGVMGGVASSVTAETESVVLECAFFNPLAIMGTARRYGVHTDSSQRFERGVDPSITLEALEYATQLILYICGGQPGPINEAVSESDLPQRKTIILRRAQISKVLGFAISDEKVADILQRLGLEIKLQDAGWSVVTPLHRFDLSLEEDLIEEVARIYGYDHIPSIVPSGQLTMLPFSETHNNVHAIRNVLVEHGYHETLSYSFIDPKLQALIFPEVEGIALQNPIANNLSVMRTSLWPNLIAAVAHNQKHQQDRVRLFEVGRVFNQATSGVTQDLKIAGVASGSREPEQWSASDAKVDFYDVKADIEALLPEAVFEVAQNSALHPGQSAKIICQGQIVGFIGSLHPRVSQQLKIAGNVVLFELDLTKIVQKSLSQYQPVSKYPQIRRDLAVVVDDGVTFKQVYDIVGNSAGDLLVDVEIFDIYRGAGIAADKKSMAVKMILQHAKRTLVDDEVTRLIDKVVLGLKTSLNAELRE